MTFVDLKDQPWQLLTLTLEDFLIGMSSLGTPQAIGMVGAFADPNDLTVRTGHRDTDIDLHRDGVYMTGRRRLHDRPPTGHRRTRRGSKSLPVDVVGMYCIRANDTPCFTTISADGKNIDHEVDLQPGQALIWDNRLWHGRRGPVGKRLLVRFWTVLK